MPTIDALALIHDVTEAADLLGQSSTLEQFLAQLVAAVARRAGADVSSIYLYDMEQDVLVLRATAGLNPALVGHVRLGSTEGLTGWAFSHNSPVFERDARTATLNKSVPDLGEEAFPSFLGVPIRRGERGIGVLTLQFRAPTDVDERALRAMRSIASHLAITLESAATLYEAHESMTPGAAGHPAALPATGMLEGTSASRGIAIGRITHLDGREDFDDTPVARSIEEAIELSAHQLQVLQRSVEETLSDVASMIFSSHLLMLRDSSFVDPMVARHASGSHPVEAVQTVVEEFCHRFAAIPDPRFQEKVEDVRDLGHRIVRNLRAKEESTADYRGLVVVAASVFPSELVKLAIQNVEGIITGGGGATGHIAILAQSLDLPVVATGDAPLAALVAGTRVVVDAEDGKVVIDPAAEILDAYRRRITRRREKSAEAGRHAIPDRVCTSDGAEVTLLANVNLVKDARAAREANAAGIGLYRSEFPFLIRNAFPTEDEQVGVYRRVVDAMQGRPVAFRTLDLGGDKLLGDQHGREDNPFLGFRGIRFLLEHRELMRDQLRAMLRAGDGCDLAIHFPMIASVDEFLEAREEVAHCIRDLASEGTAHNGHPRLGAMIELPAAIELAPDLARAVDFFSVGTNDLTMYMLAADRTNHRVASIYRALHPGVLRALARLARAALDATLPISICGASAADTVMSVFYLGIGVRRLSVDPSDLPTVARTVASVTLDEAHSIADSLLAFGTTRALNEEATRLRALLRERAGLADRSTSQQPAASGPA